MPSPGLPSGMRSAGATSSSAGVGAPAAGGLGFFGCRVARRRGWRFPVCCGALALGVAVGTDVASSGLGLRWRLRGDSSGGGVAASRCAAGLRRRVRVPSSCAATVHLLYDALPVAGLGGDGVSVLITLFARGVFPCSPLSLEHSRPLRLGQLTQRELYHTYRQHSYRYPV